MPFYYSGCEGNNNKFISQEACETDCPPDIGKIYNNKKCLFSNHLNIFSYKHC